MSKDAADAVWKWIQIFYPRIEDALGRELSPQEKKSLYDQAWAHGAMPEVAVTFVKREKHLERMRHKALF